MAEQRNIRFDAGRKSPCVVPPCSKEHGRHGVAVNDGEAVGRGFYEEAPIAVAVKRHADQLPRFTPWKRADECMVRGRRLLERPCLSG